MQDEYHSDSMTLFSNPPQFVEPQRKRGSTLVEVDYMEESFFHDVDSDDEEDRPEEGEEYLECNKENMRHRWKRAKSTEANAPSQIETFQTQDADIKL